MNLINFVVSKLNTSMTVPVYGDEDEVTDSKYVLVEMIGMSEKNMVQKESLSFRSIAESRAAAYALNLTTMEKVKELIQFDEISGIHLESSYDSTDTTKKKYRYQCIFGITHK